MGAPRRADAAELRGVGSSALTGKDAGRGGALWLGRTLEFLVLSKPTRDSYNFLLGPYGTIRALDLFLNVEQKNAGDLAGVIRGEKNDCNCLESNEH